MRETFLAINRNNNGLGKCGSTSVKDVKNSRINLFEVQASQSNNQIDTTYAPVRLGFVFYGQVQMIPHLFPINQQYFIRSYYGKKR